MRAILFTLLLSGLSALGQAEKFAGEYMGVASPSRWMCEERAVIDAFVYPNGSIEVYSYDYALSGGGEGFGTVLPNGKFTVTMDNGYVVTGKVSASGTARGIAVSSVCKYTFVAYRKTRAPYNPALE